MIGTGHVTAGDVGPPEPATVLAQVLAREGIAYPAARFADAVAEYADLHRFMALLRAAESAAVAEGRSGPPDRG